MNDQDFDRIDPDKAMEFFAEQCKEAGLTPLILVASEKGGGRVHVIYTEPLEQEDALNILAALGDDINEQREQDEEDEEDDDFGSYLDN